MVQEGAIISENEVSGAVFYISTNAKLLHLLVMELDIYNMALGFVGTPYFIVNNMVLRGALPMENFIDAVEMALKHTAAK